MSLKYSDTTKLRYSTMSQDKWDSLRITPDSCACRVLIEVARAYNMEQAVLDHLNFVWQFNRHEVFLSFDDLSSSLKSACKVASRRSRNPDDYTPFFSTLASAIRAAAMFEFSKTWGQGKIDRIVRIINEIENDTYQINAFGMKYK